MNKEIKRVIGTLCLLMLFVAYQTSIALFAHVHYVDGVVVKHSHPFQGKHTHTTAEFVIIARLSTFQGTEVDVCENLHPLRTLLAVLETEQVTPLVKGEERRGIPLRAPPMLEMNI